MPSLLIKLHKLRITESCFVRTRPGLNGKPFEMIKFRSMKDAIDTEGNPLPDSERLTSFGQALRNSSLDEFPGLWNVLKGDMSSSRPASVINGVSTIIQ